MGSAFMRWNVTFVLAVVSKGQRWRESKAANRAGAGRRNCRGLLSDALELLEHSDQGERHTKVIWCWLIREGLQLYPGALRVAHDSLWLIFLLRRRCAVQHTCSRCLQPGT